MNQQQRIKLRKQATALRLRGLTYPEIQRQTGVARGTLSGWFKGLALPDQAKKRILQRKREHLALARKEAWKSNQALLLERRARAEKEIDEWISDISLTTGVLGLLLAALYLGEGAKRRSTLIFANSRPDIIQLYLRLLQFVFKTDIKRYRVVLGLRMDQEVKNETDYWAKATGIPKNQFKKPQFDARTLGKKTFPTYHGVCTVIYNDAEVEKRLTILQQKVLDLFLGT